MSQMYRTVMCGNCGQRNFFGLAGGMTTDGKVRFPLPVSDFRMRCGFCGHVDIYGETVVETAVYDHPLTETEMNDALMRITFLD